MSITRTSLRERLAMTDEIVIVSGVLSWRGAAADRAGQASLAAASSGATISRRDDGERRT